MCTKCVQLGSDEEFEIDWEEFEFINPEWTEDDMSQEEYTHIGPRKYGPQCECGYEKSDAMYHLEWCPLYRKWEDPRLRK